MKRESYGPLERIGLRYVNTPSTQRDPFRLGRLTHFYTMGRFAVMTSKCLTAMVYYRYRSLREPVADA